MPYALWGVQGLLALVFLSAGGGKLVMSAADLNEDFPMPDEFMRFIGVFEVLGAIGLILPGALRIRPALDATGRRRAGHHHDRCHGAHAG